jgi:hypothetical protein
MKIVRWCVIVILSVFLIGTGLSFKKPSQQRADKLRVQTWYENHKTSTFRVRSINQNSSDTTAVIILDDGKGTSITCEESTEDSLHVSYAVLNGAQGFKPTINKYESSLRSCKIVGVDIDINTIIFLPVSY